MDASRCNNSNNEKAPRGDSNSARWLYKVDPQTNKRRVMQSLQTDDHRNRHAGFCQSGKTGSTTVHHHLGQTWTAASTVKYRGQRSQRYVTIVVRNYVTQQATRSYNVISRRTVPYLLLWTRYNTSANREQHGLYCITH